MKYRDSFLNEVSRFEQCNTSQATLSPSEEGLRQFYEYESKGVKPEHPDPYFVFLLDGKAWWEWTLNFVAADYHTPRWDGWYAKAIDFIDDPSGFRQLRSRCRVPVCNPQDVLDEVKRQEEEFLRLITPIPEESA